MYCHGLISLLTFATAVSLNVIPNIPGTLPPPILVDNDARVERSSIDEEFTEGLYQGDIMLTEEQRRILLSRKVLAISACWWPRSAGGGVDIDFRYADNTINRTGVQVAINRWQATTCVRFHEISASVPRSHLIFAHSSGCNSYIGRISATAGQVINLTTSCIDGVGSAIHEIGHSLGLFHEQSRRDRDNYVYIISGNINQTYTNNFNKEVDNNFSVPYDYSSVMHYGEAAFSTNGKNTIVTKDYGAQFLIGQRVDLSFMDIRAVNLQYKCINEWLTACGKAKDPCQNFGYTKSNCTCACPAGTSGVYCETLVKPYIDALKAVKSPDNILVTTETSVTSPLFPTPIITELAYAQVITAPQCSRVKITFNTFNFIPNSTFTDGSIRCHFMTLEIRTSDPPIAGTKYCGTSIAAGTTFQSVGRTMVLLFSSRPNPANYTGYNATVQFVPGTNPTCVTSASSTTTTPTTNTRSTTKSITTKPSTMTTSTTTTPTTKLSSTAKPTTTTTRTTPTTTKPTSTTSTKTATKPTTTTSTKTTTRSTTTPSKTITTTKTPTTTTRSTTTPSKTTTTTKTPTTTTRSTTTPTKTTSTTTTPTTTTKSTTIPTIKTTTTATPTETSATTTIPTTTTPTTNPPTTTSFTTTKTTSMPALKISPSCTVTNSGLVPLLASLAGSCHLSRVSATTYNLASPSYPSGYGSLDDCKGWFSTNEPRYVRVTPVEIDIGTADQLSFKQVYQNETRVTNALVGGHLVFPSSSASLSFLADSIRPGNKFSFDLEVVNSKCHQIINIIPGVTCSLSIPKNYPPGTICEWWIKAPPGTKVSVKFSRFSIGNMQCLEDFLAIDTTGNNRYSSATRFCGQQSPGTITSSSNLINILMNGRDGHFGGFDATYSVV